MNKIYDNNPYAPSEQEMEKTAKKTAKLAKKPKNKLIFFDMPFFIIIMTLIVFGLVMLYSASYSIGYYNKDDSNFYIKKQVIFAVLGVLGMLFVSRIDYHIFHKLVLPIYAVTIILLIGVLFTEKMNGARRWLTIPLINITIQPGEVAKFAIILFFAHLVSVNYKKMKTFKYGILSFAIVLLPVVGLMLMQPHLSGTIIILGIAALMMFIGGTSVKWFAMGGLVAVIALVFAVVAFEDLVPYAMTRIETWRDPFSDPSGDGYQTIQGLLAIGSGGPFGLGLGNSRQKHLFVPEPYNDYIFAILCEELGFVGAMIVILLFIALLLRGLYIAAKSRDKFGSMIVVGIIIQITLQVVLNIAVVTATIPTTGISLPFFSSGGSSLLMLLGQIGIVLSVSRQANYTNE